MGGLPLAVALMPTAEETVPPVDNADACEGLFRLANTMDFDHSWTGTIRLRQMESACVGSENEGTYWHMRATMENLLGNHRSALQSFNRVVGRRNTQQELPAHAESRPALAYVVSRVTGHQIVMVNEQHHVSTERLLTLELLRPLYDQGFRYLAVEALWEGDDELNRRSYPIRETGGYVSDVVFGELIREALTMGYEVVPYEASSEQWQPTETMTSQQARDYGQAQNLIATTIKQDPEAKVLVHCGYDHLREVPSPGGWTPMAYYFREATGIDPLTVDQTLFVERNAEGMEHPWRLAADERGLLDDQPVVLVGSDGDLVPVEQTHVDVTVLNPRTEYRNDRPGWMTLGGRRDPVGVTTPECIEETCVVEAFNPAWEERAVPYDRVEVRAAKVTMYVPPHVDIVIRGYRLDGSPAFSRMLTRVQGTHSGLRIPDSWGEPL
ncbi:MAG: hypothetical protein OXT64_07145 [Gammaproteobacteria bacterium]|nr:hypothetical protein [Gammaproteobacteria bacterium]